MRTGIFGLAAAIFFATSLMAEEHVPNAQLGPISYAGSGCPPQSVAVALSPDQKSLSLLFDEFMVEAGVGRRVVNKSCNFAIPIKVPEGYSVSIHKIDYRGFNNLPASASSKLSVAYYFSGIRGPRFSKIFRGPLDKPFLFSNTLISQASIWSPCGKDVRLRNLTRLILRTNRFSESAFSALDSVDFSEGGLVYHLKWRRCH